MHNLSNNNKISINVDAKNLTFGISVYLTSSTTN